MLQNCYFKCKNCEHIEVKYIDNKYSQNVLNNIICSECNSKEFEITETDNQKYDVKYSKVKDNRALDKEKYMSQTYKDVRKEINRIHKERKGLLGDKRIFA